MYKLIYLPAARQDMVDIVRYISRVLGNPISAERLAETLIEAGPSAHPSPQARVSKIAGAKLPDALLGG